MDTGLLPQEHVVNPFFLGFSLYQHSNTSAAEYPIAGRPQAIQAAPTVGESAMQ